MFFFCELVLLTLALTFDGHVYSGEIYGGHQAVPHSRPYMVLLEQHFEDGTKGHCGGFLLSEDFVMTAAHCQAKSYTVLLGVHNIHDKNGIQHISVKQAFPHQDFNATIYENDIMLLKLGCKAHFNDNVRAIALTDQGGDTLPRSCIVSGWGRSVKNSNYMTKTLMEVNVTLVQEQPNKKHLYCSMGETGPAKGDSGGPLVCEDEKAFGVVSVADKSGGQQMYYYTKINDYREWIDGILGFEGKF